MVSKSIMARALAALQRKLQRRAKAVGAMRTWPELSIARDHETLSVLHLAAQMLGKIRVAHAPWMNHGWHVALQPSARLLDSADRSM
jgi:hypothetical protein